LDGYAVDCLPHNQSTWMLMPLTVFGKTIQLALDGYAVEYLQHNHSTWMVMKMTVFSKTIGWL
jgi:hypothetical protein